jgi:hypothetical protein
VELLLRRFLRGRFESTPAYICKCITLTLGSEGPYGYQY